MWVEESNSLFVENKCEGLVKAKDLPGDFFVHDQKNHRFVGERTGKKFQLGDPPVLN